MQDDASRLREMRRRAHEAGDVEAARRLTQRIRGDVEPRVEMPSGGAEMSRDRAGNLGAAQGVSLGFADEATGLLANLATRAYNLTTDHDINPGSMQEMATGIHRDQVQEARETHPVTMFASEALGGSALPIGGAGFVGNATTRLGMAGRAALIGAGTGAAVGFGEDEGGFEERLDGAAVGAGVGAVIGGAAPIVLSGLSRVGMNGARVLTRAYRRVRGGESLTRDQRRAWTTLLSEAREAGVSEQDIVSRLDELQGTGLSDEQSMFELLGGNATERARGGVATGNADALQGRDRVNARQSRQPARVQEYLREGIDADGSEFSAARETLNTPTALERRLYDEFREQGGAELGEFLENPRFARIARAAVQDVMDETGQQASTEGASSPAVFDAIKRRMDRMINDAERGATQNTAQSRPLRQLRSRFVAYADEAYPNYSAAREQGAQRLSAREALEEGRNIFRTDNVRNPEELARMVRDMTPEQAQRFRQGVARGVVDQMNASPRNVVDVNGESVAASARDASNPISRFWNRADRQEALRAAFGDEAQFETFVRRMAVEGDRAATFGRVSTRTQGSPTQANQFAERLASGAADAADVASGMPFNAAFRRIARLASRPDANLEAEIQRILWSTVPEQRPRLLQALRARDIITTDQARALAASGALAAPVTGAAVGATQN